MQWHHMPVARAVYSCIVYREYAAVSRVSDSESVVPASSFGALCAPDYAVAPSEPFVTRHVQRYCCRRSEDSVQPQSIGPGRLAAYDCHARMPQARPSPVAPTHGITWRIQVQPPPSTSSAPDAPHPAHPCEPQRFRHAQQTARLRHPGL